MQLASQAKMLPISTMRELSAPNLTTLLHGILPYFERTYLILDGFLLGTDGSRNPLLPSIRSILEIENANVSLAIFPRSSAGFEEISDLSDVTVRLLKIDPKAEDIRSYVQLKMQRMESGLSQTQLVQLSERWIAIENAIVIASDGL